MTWSLPELLSGMNEDVQQRLGTARKCFGHAPTKGDASEQVWLDLLQRYLPQRYQVAPAHVVDSKDEFSEQIDIVVFDRQYSPFIFTHEGQKVIPAESVYAVFEAKQAISARNVAYAQRKVASVRRLLRTSLPIPTANGTADPKPLHPICGGVLALESDWTPALGSSLIDVLETDDDMLRLELGCIANHGYFKFDGDKSNYVVCDGDKPATAFLFELISHLQTLATVPMIDITAYARWLDI